MTILVDHLGQPLEDSTRTGNNYFRNADRVSQVRGDQR